MDVTNAGAIPTMEAALAYAFRRHEIIVNNIANSSTPGFHAQDLPVAEFNEVLARATRPERPSPVVLGQPFEGARPSMPSFNPTLFSPSPVPGVPGADGNTVVPELEASKMAKNAALFTALSQLLARQYDLIEKAIRERI
ncbi:MAG: hypothetical protein HYY18_00055 [Planctomycetes bacterium]|nr:hypothetical protein [Planctomycetota bacterium]